ncbi:hypothetical protein OAG51_00030 [Pirellulaceae bacterium]|nr:hypothetical protein [Pirellulaceae bacterium]
MESGVGGNESGTHRGARFTGTEPVFGGFTHAATIVSNIRLTHEGKIFAAVNDLGAAVTALAREYRFHGDPIRAHQEMARLKGLYTNRVQQWKSQESKRLQQKKSMNGFQIRDLEKELNRVHLDIARGETVFNRLVNDLDLITRVGEESPLLQPETQRKYRPRERNDSLKTIPKKKVNKTRLSLMSYLMPHGMTFRPSDAIYKDDLDETLLEHCYDNKNYISIMVHWSNRHPETRDRGGLYLRILIIPKVVEAMDQLPRLINANSFFMESDGEELGEIEFRRIGISDEKTLVHRRLCQFLRDVEATSFQNRKMVVKKAFEFYAADFIADLPYELARKMVFCLRARHRS